MRTTYWYDSHMIASHINVQGIIKFTLISKAKKISKGKPLKMDYNYWWWKGISRASHRNVGQEKNKVNPN